MAMSGIRSAHPYGKLALVVMLGVSVGVTVFTGTHTKGTHAYSSTTYDLGGYKVNTNGTKSGAWSDERIRLERLSNGTSASTINQPYSFPGYPAVSGGESIKVYPTTPNSGANGWTVKGSTFCDGCGTISATGPNYANGTSRTFKAYPNHNYHMWWIWQYLAPSAPKLSGSVSGSKVSLSWTASSQPGGAAISYYYVYKSGSQVLKTTSRSAAFTLSCNVSFSYTVKSQDANGHYSAASNVYSGTTAACPTPPPPTPTPSSTIQATPTPTPTPGSGGGGGTPKPTPKPSQAPPKPGSGGSSSGSGSAPADTTPPQPPAGFKAAPDDGNIGITLTWNAASDPSGIAGYNLEHSTDRSNWTSVDTNITATTYDDQGTGFDTHYYYRLTATDNAGNTSNYALADASTGQFQSNASGGSGLTVTSDDKLAVAIIPNGALDNDSDCQLVDDQTAAKTSQSELAGPYKLLCKDSQGNEVDSFQKEISWTINLSHKEKRYDHIAVALLDEEGNVSDAGAKFNKKSDVMAFTAQASGPFVVLGTLKHGLPWGTIISIILILLAAGGGIGYLIYRQRGKQDYDDYLRRKYYDF